MKHESDILKRIKSYFMRRKSATEAHRFEREMERDPFLYEAMEGLEDLLTSDIQQALDELDDRLDERSQRRGMVFTWQAAAIGLVIVAGTTVFAILGGQSNDPDTTGTQGDYKYDPRTTQPSYEAMDDEPAYVVSDSVEDEDEIEPSSTSEVEQAPPPVEMVAFEPVKESTTLGGDLTANDPLQNEMRSSESDEEDVEAGTLAHTSKAVESIAVSEDEVSMAPSKSLQVQELKSKASSARQKSESADPTSAPEGGMDAYRAYLKNNLQRTTGMPLGEVVLSFEFDRNGTPKSVKVENSLCTACDAEAIRLIEQGPKWNAPDRKERVFITVSFDR
ncbi:MAG: hypothetical protein RLP15_07085 [Cryomorphaceae bacterium]